jgi:hypothetical protein
MFGTVDFLNADNETKEMSSVLLGTFETFQKFLPEDSTSFLAYNTYHPWILSVAGAIVVGLSGIVPFIIIPLDATDSWTSGSKYYLRINMYYCALQCGRGFGWCTQAEENSVKCDCESTMGTH